MTDIPQSNDKAEQPKDGSGNSTGLNGGDILHQDYLERQQAKQTEDRHADATQAVDKTASGKGGADAVAAAVAGAEAGAKVGELQKDASADQRVDASKPFNEAEFRKQLEKLTPQEQQEMLKANEKSIEVFKTSMLETLKKLAEAHPEEAKEFEALKKAIDQYGVINSWSEVASQKH